MKNKFLLKTLVLILVFTVALSIFAGCKNNDKPGEGAALPMPDGTAAASPTATPAEEDDEEKEEIEDVPESTEFVAKMGDIPFYESDMTYFFSRVLSDAVLAEENLYSDDMSNDEIYEALTAFLKKKPEGSDKTNRELFIEQALDSCHTFNIAASIAKENELLSNDDITELKLAFNSKIDQYAEYYGFTRDEFAEYSFGMPMNDTIRFTVNQEYAKEHMEDWLQSKGYSLTAEKPTAPEKPTEPAEDASDAEKAEYTANLKTYNEKYAQYEKKLEEYNNEAAKYWEKYREDYNKNPENYKVVTLRYLYVSTLGEDGKALSADKKQEKYNNVLTYKKLVEDMGLDFANVVKGFTESDAEDNGFCDIDITGGSTSLSSNIIEWALKTAKVSNDLKIFEEGDGYYIVQIAGVVDYDKVYGKVASDETTPELVKKAVEEVVTTTMYNKYIKELTKDSKYALSDINMKRINELVENYLDTI